jgi:peptidoglycan/LPS O-acetylase OafA/YrhL
MARGYRPDVDGLRAVAVLLVVGRHLRVSWLSGGFVGVDVFFVISGYLISSIIMPQILDGTFSLTGFYERRIRRIFPALAVMLAVSSLLAWKYLLPSEMVGYARSMVGALFGFSNVVFWNWVGYFDGPNELKPLLHTWSLGVEEQFYLCFPLLLLAGRRLGVTVFKRWVCGLTVVSFVAACGMTLYLPSDAFYFAPLRAWELLLGILVSQAYVPSIRTSAGRNVAACAGLAMILATGLLYTVKTSFPGLGALPPCLGAALIIAAGETGTSFVGQFLSLRPMVFVGLISYSLYLWHWPVQVFYDYAHLLTGRHEDDWRAVGFVFTISFVVAVLSWAFVERPVRAGRLWPSRGRLFLGSGAFAGVALLLAVGVVRSEGAPKRFSAETVAMARYLDYDNHDEDRWGRCAFGPLLTTVSMLDRTACLPYSEGKKHLLLVGDSHAAHLWPGFAAVFPEFEVSQVNMSECPILAGMDTAPKACGAMSRFIFEDWLPHHPVDALLVSYRWTEGSLPDAEALVAYGRAHHVNVILFGPSVEYAIALPRLLAMGADAHEQEVGWPRAMDLRMKQMAKDRWGVEYISFFDDVCAGGCPVYAAPGMPMGFDANHLTAAGAKVFLADVKTSGEIR